MIDLSKELQADIERREAAFISKLAKVGLDALVVEYQDIITLRQAVEVTAKKVRGVRPQKLPLDDSYPNDARTRSMAAHGVNVAPPNFVLSDAVRDAIREIGAGRFRTLEVFNILRRDYPIYITEDKRASISATLSNLVTSNEIGKHTDSQRKVWYQVIRLRNDSSQDGQDEVSGFDADLDKLKGELPF